MPVSWGCAPPEHSHKQICVVDDDEWVADSLKLLLEIFRLAVQSYTSCSELFSDARCRTARCLVIDQHMPDMDGLEIVERLQKEGVRVPTILISARSGDD